MHRFAESTRCALCGDERLPGERYKIYTGFWSRTSTPAGGDLVERRSEVADVWEHAYRVCSACVERSGRPSGPNAFPEVLTGRVPRIPAILALCSFVATILALCSFVAMLGGPPLVFHGVRPSDGWLPALIASGTVVVGGVFVAVLLRTTSRLKRRALADRPEPATAWLDVLADNRVRRAWSEAEWDVEPLSGLRIKLEAPPVGATTGDATIAFVGRVCGAARDGAVTVRVEGRDPCLPTVETPTSWSCLAWAQPGLGKTFRIEVPLRPGDNALRVEATDGTKGNGTDRRAVVERVVVRSDPSG